MKNLQEGEEYLPLITEALDAIIASPRWKDSDTPMPGSIKELSVRINDGKKYRTIRENPNLNLLLKIIEGFEEDLNDDWMPYEIFELELKKAFKFIQKIKEIIKNNSINEFDQKIKETYKKIKL